jgi:hypothetical protein
MAHERELHNAVLRARAWLYRQTERVLRPPKPGPPGPRHANSIVLTPPVTREKRK